MLCTVQFNVKIYRYDYQISNGPFREGEISVLDCQHYLSPLPMEPVPEMIFFCMSGMYIQSHVKLGAILLHGVVDEP